MASFLEGLEWDEGGVVSEMGYPGIDQHRSRCSLKQKANAILWTLELSGGQGEREGLGVEKY